MRKADPEPSWVPSWVSVIIAWLSIAFIWCLSVFLYDFGSNAKAQLLTSAQWLSFAFDCAWPPLSIWVLWRIISRSQLLERVKGLPADSIVKINPLRWKLEHQLAWIVACVFGAVVAMLYGFSHSKFGMPGAGMGVHFLFWLQQPEFYWHWALSGALIAGLSFYLARLLKT
jgi:hypothetical protein